MDKVLLYLPFVLSIQLTGSDRVFSILAKTVLSLKNEKLQDVTFLFLSLAIL